MAVRDYDLVDVATGDVVMIVRHMWPAEPVECCICGKDTHSPHAVPYYCGVVREGQSEGGYKSACEPCYNRWEAWGASFETATKDPK